MTEQQRTTRDRYIEELKSTGRQGWGCVVSYLDSHRFFDRAHCSGHDRYPGGTANHSLWVLRFARETAAGIRKSRPGFEIPDDSLVFACLLHDVCDCNPRFGGHGRCSRHLMEHRIRGIRFTEEELSAVMAHMHGKLHVSGRVSRRSSDNFGEVLHYILHNSDHRSIEYGGEIPWNEEPRRINPKYRSSYVVARKTNGKWGVFSVKDQSADSNGYPIGITNRLDYIYDDPESAIEALRGNTGHPVRILHSDFFKHIVVRP